MGENSGFICFDGYLERTSKLSDQELGRLMRALMRYHANGTEPSLKGREEIAFDFIREDIDRTDRKYAEKCEQNRRNRTGANNGQRPTTTDDDRQRPSTTVDESERTATNSDERAQSKSKSKTKRKEFIDDDDDDDDSYARARTYERQVAITAAYQQHVGRQPTREEVNALVTSGNLLGFSPEMLAEAIRIASGNGAKSIVSYAKRILDDWKRNEVTTPEEAEEHKFLFDAWTGRNEYGTGDGMDLQRMDDARKKRKEKHAEETA